MFLTKPLLFKNGKSLTTGMDRKLIITADDLGIDEKVNRGIIEAYEKGVLTSTSLLMNAPATQDGIELSKNHPGLEVGLHLSIVEGISLRNLKSSVTDKLSYFEDRICLKRNWKSFLRNYFTGCINLRELKEEMELQFKAFQSVFKHIPFVNGTQHMHLLPSVFKITLDLSVKFKVGAMRLPKLYWPNPLWLNKRLPFLLGFELLGSAARSRLRFTKIKTPSFVHGMQYAGHLDSRKLRLILTHMQSGTNEIVMHPGYRSEGLARDLPWAYSKFNWDIERLALISEDIRSFLKIKGIRLIQFADL